jgi:uncharacterized protein (TIGR02466 family)|tara:strand:+ start:68 stop:670 length:603 start_codon:yes stop_codon:yes gene_type:complete
MLNNIFSPFYFKDSINNDTMKSSLVPVMVSEYNKNKNNQPSAWNCRCYTTLEANNTILQNYEHRYDTIISKFLREEGFKACEVFLDSMWYNVYGIGQWQEAHTHNGPPPTPQFSAVHFLKFNPNVHSAITFSNPSRVVNAPFSVPYDTTTNYWNPKQTLTDIKEGDVIIFPSTLEHEVPVQTTDELRITISFNIMLKPEV